MRPAGLLPIALLLSALQANATTLTFEGKIKNTPIPEDYGSRADASTIGINTDDGATPGIDLRWTAAANGQKGFVKWEFYTDDIWRNVAQLNDAQTAKAVYSISFTPVGRTKVVIDGFDFTAYGPAYRYDMDWSVVRVTDGLTMASGTTGPFTGPNPVPVDIGFTAPDRAAYRIDLKRHGDTPATSNTGDGIAIARLKFKQVDVPEPTTYGLLGAGSLAAVALIRRRRKI